MKLIEGNSKQEKILIAAESVFATEGFEGASTRQIAKEAGVNISMISYYFGSKEKLFESIFEFRTRESFLYAEEIIENAALDPWEKIVWLTNSYIERVHGLRNFYKILQREQITNKNQNVISFLNSTKKSFLCVYAKIRAEGIDQGLFHDPSPVEFVHASVSGTLFMAMNNEAIYADYNNDNKDYTLTFASKFSEHILKLIKYLLGYDKNK